MWTRHGLNRGWQNQKVISHAYLNTASVTVAITPKVFPPSRLSAEGGLIEFLHALRTAKGRDYISTDRVNARNLSLRWIYHIGGAGEGKFPSRGTYGGDDLYQDGVRASFAQGFGAVPEQYRNAMLWTYDTFIHQRQQVKTWNATTLPIWAVYAFSIGPWVKPHKTQRKFCQRYWSTPIMATLARNRWQDSNDIIVTFLSEVGPKGYYAAKDGPGHGRSGRMRIWGLGQTFSLDVGGRNRASFFQAGKDGSFLLTAKEAIAVDMSGTSGAELVIVSAGLKTKGKKKKNKNKKNQTKSRTTTDHAY